MVDSLTWGIQIVVRAVGVLSFFFFFFFVECIFQSSQFVPTNSFFVVMRVMLVVTYQLRSSLRLLDSLQRMLPSSR